MGGRCTSIMLFLYMALPCSSYARRDVTMNTTPQIVQSRNIFSRGATPLAAFLKRDRLLI